MLFYPPTKNGTQKTLDSQLDAGVTASATLNNVTSIQNKPGVFVVNRIDANGNELPAANREYIKYTGTSGSTVTTLTRNVDGSTTDQDHAVGSIVEFIPDVTWAEGITDALGNLVTPSTGAVDPAKILPTSYLDTDGTLAANSDTKIATQKAVKTYVDANAQTLTKGTASDINTGTDDAKYITSLAIAGSTLLKSTTTRFKLGSFTRAQDGANGNVAYTGVGFQPKVVIFLASVSGIVGGSIGFDNATTYLCKITGTNNVETVRNTGSIHTRDNSAWEEEGKIATMDSDGFTITWTAGGSPPSGTITVYYIALY